MDVKDNKQGKYALVREMWETPDIIERMDYKGPAGLAKVVREKGGLFMTGEGSSRILPAHNAIALARRGGLNLALGCEGGRQALEYNLKNTAVIGASNSGKTREVIELLRGLKRAGHDALFGLTATAGSPLEKECRLAFVLGCGKEDAVAATKSVVEQALFYQVVVAELMGRTDWPGTLKELAGKARQALAATVDPAMAKRLASAQTICFAGRNDGAAEELALKTCEITRKKGVYCEGTYIVHGIEEVLDPADAVVLIEPYESEFDKYSEVLRQGVGLYVAAIATKPTPFPTLIIPAMKDFEVALQLCAGWNLLVAAGLELGINLDKPQRARKVGYELVE
jgi:glutamine---fructose-6-phosphate transaminase (isomerizing)